MLDMVLSYKISSNKTVPGNKYNTQINEYRQVYCPLFNSFKARYDEIQNFLHFRKVARCYPTGL